MPCTVIIFTPLPDNPMLQKIFYILLISFIAQTVAAQDTLPKITVTKLGKKALVSWVNPYQTVTSINIQRSGDSLRNFTSIGTVLNVNAPSNGFVDNKEFIPNDQFYRLFISFEGGSYIFTDSHRPGPDTLKAAPKAIVVALPEPQPAATEKQKKVQLLFVPSQHVFTGKDNNVKVEVRNAKKNNYSIKIFEDDGTFLFEIKKIPEDNLIIDKSNFLHSGLFRFELYENHRLIERHKLYIAEEGKPMPLLDINGYEIKYK